MPRDAFFRWSGQGGVSTGQGGVSAAQGGVPRDVPRDAFFRWLAPWAPKGDAQPKRRLGWPPWRRNKDEVASASPPTEVAPASASPSSRRETSHSSETETAPSAASSLLDSDPSGAVPSEVQSSELPRLTPRLAAPFGGTPLGIGVPPPVSAPWTPPLSVAPAPLGVVSPVLAAQLVHALAEATAAASDSSARSPSLREEEGGIDDEEASSDGRRARPFFTLPGGRAHLPVPPALTRNKEEAPDLPQGLK